MILLDTCALLWLAAGRAPRAGAAEAIEAARPDDAILVSPISAWEIAQKEQKRPGSLGLTTPALAFFRRAAAQPGIRVVALTPEIATPGRSRLKGSRPATRWIGMIVATALAYDARLLTADARMLAYPAVATIDYGRPGCSWPTSAAPSAHAG